MKLSVGFLAILPLAAGIIILSLFLYFQANNVSMLRSEFFYIYFLLLAGFTATALIVDFDREDRKKTVAAGYFTLYASMVFQAVFLLMLLLGGILAPEETIDKNNRSKRNPSLRATEWCVELLEIEDTENTIECDAIGDRDSRVGGIITLLYFQGAV